MKQFRTLVSAVCGKLFADFIQRRLSAEYPDGVDMGQRQLGRQAQDRKAGSGLPMVGVH